MKAVEYHIQAIKETFNQLSKGNFLIYFLPGVIITLFFVMIYSVVGTIFGATTESTGWFAVAFTKVGSVIDFILTQFYIFIVLTILSPFNTLLSEKLDTKLTGQKFSFSIIRLFNDLIRMALIVLFSLLIQLVAISIWWFFCWIFGISDTVIYQLFAFLIASFFFGFTFYDHSLERYEINVFGSIGFAFSNIFLVTLTGIAFKLLYYFPYIWNVSYIGIIIAPVLTTMIATIVYLKISNKFPQKQEEKNEAE